VKQQDGLEGFTKMMRVFFAIIMSGMGLGQTSSFAPDAAKVHPITCLLFRSVSICRNIIAQKE
jgi:hypothetical protein